MDKVTDKHQLFSPDASDDESEPSNLRALVNCFTNTPNITAGLHLQTCYAKLFATIKYFMTQAPGRVPWCAPSFPVFSLVFLFLFFSDISLISKTFNLSFSFPPNFGIYQFTIQLGTSTQFRLCGMKLKDCNKMTCFV